QIMIMKSFTIWRFSDKNLEICKKKREGFSTNVIPWLALLILAFGLTTNAEGQTFKDNIAQAENINFDLSAEGAGLHWANGALQRNNSAYSEGMSTLQRIIFENLPETSEDVHILQIKILTRTSGKHAYDFITSWEQSMAVAQKILPTNLIS